MTTRFVFGELKKLVAIDEQINAIKKEVATVQKNYAEQTAHLLPLVTQADSLKTTVKDLQKEIDRIALNVADMQAEFDKKDRVLGTLGHPKEYRALETELAGLERRISGSQKESSNLRDKQDTAQLEHDEVVEKLTAEQAKTAALKTEADQQVAAAEEQIAELDKAWKEQFTKVPPALSATYAQIRERVANPVVPVVSSSCSACFESLLYQDNEALDEKTTIRCRSCYRFLFLPDALPESIESAE